MYISSCTNGAAVAPICRPKREQSACGMISPGRGWGGWAGVGGRAQLGGARRLISAPLQSPIAAVCTSRVATTSREVHALRRHGPRCLARRGRSLQAQHARATNSSREKNESKAKTKAGSGSPKKSTTVTDTTTAVTGSASRSRNSGSACSMDSQPPPSARSQPSRCDRP